MTTLAQTSLPPALRDYVLRFVARRRRVSVYRTVGLAASFALLWVMLESLADRFLHFNRGVRVVLLLVNLGVVVSILRRPLFESLKRKVDWSRAASQIESRSGKFGERLQTITTQMLDRPEHRGSRELLDAILTDVDRDAAHEDPDALIPAQLMLGPWIAVLSVVVVLGLLAVIPWLGMPRLIARSVSPWSHIPPVTTTVLEVQPKDAQVLQGQAMKVTVQGRRLGGETPVISISSDGKSWHQQDMAAAAQGEWAFTLPPVDRDLQYYVKGGDAQSDTYAVQVLRKPAVAEFRIRYTYPAYTNKPVLAVTNTDGTIEAPVGTEAAVSISATEPLSDAVLIAGDQTIHLNPTIEPTVREMRMKIEKDLKPTLQMTSNRNVVGNGPSTLIIRAVPDLAPIAKFIQPLEDLRLTPHDVATIQYLATDDYGVTALALAVQVNLSAAVEMPIPLRGDPRYREGSFDLDLSTLSLKIGDLIRISLVARDGAGHVSPSKDERYILISPRAIDINAHLRLVEAEQAASLAEALAQDMEAAAKTLVDARAKVGTDTHDVDALMTTGQDLSSAATTAAMLRQLLLKSIVHSNAPEMSIALARWVDDVQTLATHVDRAENFLDTIAQGALPDRLNQGAVHARELRDKLHVVAQGQLAQAVLSEREDLRSAKKAGPVAGNKQMTEISQRTMEDIAAGAKDLALDPKAPDFEAQLLAKVTATTTLLKQQTPIDFATESLAWIKDLSANVRELAAFDARLITAAQAEALRPDANLIRARDLQLAGKAATAIDGGTAPLVADSTPTQPVTDFKVDYSPALAAMQRDDDLEINAVAKKDAATTTAVRAAAIDGRKKMAIWAGIAPPPGADDVAAKDQKALDAAMQANADMQRHDYDKVAQGDKDLAKATEDSSKKNPSSAPNPANPNNPADPSKPTDGPQPTDAPKPGDQASANDPSNPANPPDPSNPSSPSNPSKPSDSKSNPDHSNPSQSSQTPKPGQPSSPDPSDSGHQPDASAKNDNPDGSPDQPSASAKQNSSAAAHQHEQSRVAHAMESARKLDALREKQDKITSDTDAATTPDQAKELAREQRAVAEAVKQVDKDEKKADADDAQDSNDGTNPPPDDANPDSRANAIATIQAAMERLAAMPQQLSGAQQAAAARKTAAAQADAAAKALANAANGTPDAKAAAKRVDEQARKDLADADARQAAAGKPVNPDVADAISQKLEPFAPETSQATDAIDQHLTPALRELQQAQADGDPAAVDKAVATALKSINEVQDRLRESQNAYVERDPLVAAKWFAEAAAHEMSDKNGDMKAAGEHQRDTSMALAKAWDQAAHRASSGRLAQVPALSSILSLYSDKLDLTGVGTGGLATATGAPPKARDWGRLRPLDQQDVNASLHESDPPGYEEPLKAYFEALNKARGDEGAK